MSRTEQEINQEKMAARGAFLQDTFKLLRPGRFEWLFRKQRERRRERRRNEARHRYNAAMTRLNQELAEITGQIVVDTARGVVHLPEPLDGSQVMVFEASFGEAGYGDPADTCPDSDNPTQK